MNFSTIKTTAVRTTQYGLLLGRKYLPEILLFGGVGGVVVSTIFACKATLKADEILEKAKANVDKIKKASLLIDDEYTKEIQRNDLIRVYTHTGTEFVKLYGPSVTLGLASLASILYSHNLMRKRMFAVIAAYKVVEQSFVDYRKRVVDDLGEEKDLEYRYGIQKVKVTEKVTDPETGKTKTVKSEVISMPVGNKLYERKFQKGNPFWEESAFYNANWILGIQNYCNDKLNSTGALFLNEVYEQLGFETESYGQIIGWLRTDIGRGVGDGFISFGILDHEGNIKPEVLSGRPILLDFNVDGVVWDLI